jgi:hypothetical protein
MHPLLRDPRRLAIYLATWAVVGTLFASMVAVTRNAPLSSAALVVIPLMLVDGLICLSAWWVVRGVGQSSMLELTNRTMTSALQASAVWVGLSTPWMVLMSNLGVMRLGTGEVLLGAAALFIVGIPLYGVSMGIHYLCASPNRRARPSAACWSRRWRPARLSSARCGRSSTPLPVQQPELDQRPGGNRPEGARRMCESLGDFLRRTLAWARANR